MINLEQELLYLKQQVNRMEANMLRQQSEIEFLTRRVEELEEQNENDLNVPDESWYNEDE